MALAQRFENGHLFILTPFMAIVLTRRCAFGADLR